MVKGNWERRVELVAARRIENKNKKLEKQSKVSIITGESVFTKIINDELLLNDPHIKIMVWLEVINSIDICSSWWRTENCEYKKCKYLHTITIANINKIVTNIEKYDGSLLTTEKLCECKEISTILRKDAHRIRMISLNNQCIYDYYVPPIWIEWSNERKCYLNSLQKQINLITTIDEHVEMDEDDSHEDEFDNQHNIGNLIGDINDHMNIKCEDNKNHTNMASHFLRFLEQETKDIQLYILLVCSYLIDSEMIMFSNINRNIQKYCLKNDIIRNRKKEIYSNYFKEQNKKKKIIERKKLKQANISKKNNKKDGFARGGNSK